MKLQVRTRREDAGPSLFLSQELEYVLAEQYRAELAPLKILSLIPVRTDVDPRAQVIAYSYLTQTGYAAIMRMGGGGEVPRVDLYRQKFQSVVKSLEVAYGWSMEDMESAEMAGVPLDRELADAARRAMAELVSDIAINGNEANQIPGLLTNPNIPRTTVPDGASTDPEWTTKTADEILNDMSSCASSIVSTSKGAFAPDTLLMPIEQYTLIADMPRASFSDETVLSYFLRTSPFIKKVDWLRELDGAGTGGTDAMIAFKNDPTCFAYFMVRPFEQHPQQERNMRVDVYCRERTGGVIVQKPIALSIYEGI